MNNIESIRIKNFETETSVINANQSRQEERLKQVQSSINGFQKSITKINEKLVSTNAMATIKVNPVTTEQTPIPMVNPRYEKPKPKTQPDRDNGTIDIEQCRRSVGNTETSTRQGHPPPRTTGKQVARTRACRWQTNATELTHTVITSGIRIEVIHRMRKGKMQNSTSLRALRTNGELATTWQELVHGQHEPDL